MDDPRAYAHGVKNGLTVLEVTIIHEKKADNQHTASEGHEYLLVGPVVPRPRLIMNGNTTRVGLAVGCQMRCRGGFQGV